MAKSTTTSAGSGAAKRPSPELVWIHCNKCFEIYIRKRRTIFLLSCQHTACEGCVQRAPDNYVICPICKKSCLYNPLGSQLHPKYKQYFHPRPWIDLGNLARVIPFQMRHRDNFLKGLNKAESHADKMEEDNKLLKEKCKAIYYKREKIRNFRVQLEEEVMKLKRAATAKFSPEDVVRNRMRTQVNQARSQKSEFVSTRPGPLDFSTTSRHDTSSGYYSTNGNDFSL